MLSINSKTRRGFTLVELLVVVSIISLLSSIVIASIKSARDKGVIASGLQFDGYITRTQGDRAAVWWKFDEVSGSVTKDYSAFRNDGTVAVFSAPNYSPAPSPTWTTDVPVGGRKGSLYYDGTYVTFSPASTRFNVGGGNKGFTMMAWVKPTVAQGSMVISRYLPYLGLQVSGQPRFVTRRDAGGGGVIVQATGGTVPLNQWTHLAGIYGSDGYARLYINGKEVDVSDQAPGNDITNYNTHLMVGAWSQANVNIQPVNFFVGYIDEPVFINEALSTAELEKYFAESSARVIAQN